jgi:hypothetical protein
MSLAEIIQECLIYIITYNYYYIDITCHLYKINGESHAIRTQGTVTCAWLER